MNKYEVYVVPVAGCDKEWTYLADFEGSSETEAVTQARQSLEIPDSVFLVGCICVEAPELAGRYNH